MNDAYFFRSVTDVFDALSLMKAADAAKVGQLTLQEVIDRLSVVGQDKTCVIEGSVDGNPGGVTSYRGYYTDLALEPDQNRDVPVSEVLGVFQRALYSTYEGWKGGYYTMFPTTLVWVAIEGMCDDDAIIDIVEEPHAVVLVTGKTHE